MRQWLPRSFDVGWTLLVAVAAVTAGAIAVLPTGFALLAGAAIVALGLRVRSLALLLFASVCALGLVRRLISGGRTEADPLLLAPIALLALIILQGRDDRERDRTTMTDVLLGALVFLPVLAWAANDRTITGLFAAGLYSASFATILAASAGRIPDVRATIVRAAPIGAIVLSGYGLLQFFALPTWDRRWMLASELRSIGLPLPRQVRVFGSLESPTPFAVVLGGLMILLAHRVIAQGVRPGERLLATAALAAALPTFFLTGVRTGILALFLVLLLTLVKTRRASIAALVAAGGLLVVVFGRRIIDAAGNRGNVFVADRYSTGGLAADRSLQQRLLLLDEIGPGLRQPLGSGYMGAGGARLDNLFVDLLIIGGPLLAALALALAATVSMRALAFDWRAPNAAWHMVVIYTAIFALSAPIFATTSGLLVAVVWGWVLSDRRRASEADPESTQPKPTFRSVA